MHSNYVLLQEDLLNQAVYKEKKDVLLQNLYTYVRTGLIAAFNYTHLSSCTAR